MMTFLSELLTIVLLVFFASLLWYCYQKELKTSPDPLIFLSLGNYPRYPLPLFIFAVLYRLFCSSILRVVRSQSDVSNPTNVLTLGDITTIGRKNGETVQFHNALRSSTNSYRTGRFRSSRTMLVDWFKVRIFPSLASVPDLICIVFSISSTWNV